MWEKVIIPMVTSPFAGLILAFLVMRLIVVMIFRNKNPQKVGGGFRHAQSVRMRDGDGPWHARMRRRRWV